MIDASAVARVVGVETLYRDISVGGAQYLPQRIAVFAQGSADAVYSLEKWTSTGAAAGGARYGFGSPIHHILRQLQPANGDGVGTIPIDVFPLSDVERGTPAEGSITPSGTATKGAAYRLRIGGVLSAAFVIPAGPVDVMAANAAMAAAVRSVLEMPVRVFHSYGEVMAGPVPGNVGNGTLTDFEVTGDPVPGTWRLVCKSAVPNGGIFALLDPSLTTVATLPLTVGPGVATAISSSGWAFTITDGTTDFAVGDQFTMTAPAADVQFVAKWNGEGGNGIKIEVIGESAGVVFDISQMEGGLVNPSVSEALSKIGGVWVSMAINGAPIEDTTILDEFQEFGEGRWIETVGKPLVVFTGVTHASLEEATAVCSGRQEDRVNAQLVAPGSPDMPFVVAARQLARIAKTANNDPAMDYGGQRATGITPGSDKDQWDGAVRDLAVKLGSSTIDVRDGVVAIGDVVTFARPRGEEPPHYRFVKDIVRLQTVLFRFWVNFNKPEWDGAPLIPDNQPTTNPNARKPMTAKAEAAAILDDLGLQAILSDPVRSKKNILAQISSSNPNRLDMTIPVQLSGNSNIKSLQLRWAFYFGTAAVVG